MKGWIRKTWMGCVVALALGAPVAYADGGRIQFVGAIVEPTCSLGDRVLAATNVSSSDHANAAPRCGDRAGAESIHPRSYATSVESLQDSALSSDRVLTYFSDYLQASGQPAMEARLVTQSYL